LKVDFYAGKRGKKFKNNSQFLNSDSRKKGLTVDKNGPNVDIISKGFQSKIILVQNTRSI